MSLLTTVSSVKASSCACRVLLRSVTAPRKVATSSPSSRAQLPIVSTRNLLTTSHQQRQPNACHSVSTKPALTAFPANNHHSISITNTSILERQPCDALLNFVSTRQPRRGFCSSADEPPKDPPSEGEQLLIDTLRGSLDISDIEVRDISGGCGSMYEVYVCSREFAGKRTLAQHRMVKDILKEHVKQMHGLRVMTTVPPTEDSWWQLKCYLRWNRMPIC